MHDSQVPEETLVPNILPEPARRILIEAYERAKELPVDSLARRLEIEYAIDFVRANWPKFFKVD